MSLKWIQHNNRKILVVDYRLLTQKQILAQINEAAVVVHSAPHPVRVLSIFINVPIAKKIIDESVELGKKVFSKKTERSAVVGITGLKKIFLKMYCSFSNDAVYPFDTIDKALQFLTDSDEENLKEVVKELITIKS